ncbi:cistern family PEP-CTERM protein [Sandarakinorhabdus sp.]|uniref:cistern family PEP-CTERM protein n=1 Tax=Sandarakinorhabdus sp. TaxID=1916663 RepID=UPI00333F90E5
MNDRASVFVLLVAASLAAPAAATVEVTDALKGLTKESIGTTFTINYNGLVDSKPQEGLSASMLFTLNSIADTNRTWNFTVAMANQSGSPMTAARITGFGMGLQGYDGKGKPIAITAASALQAKGGPEKPLFGQVLEEKGLGSDVNVPGLGKIADVCFMAGNGTTNNCSGGGGGGLDMATKGNPFPATSQVMTLSFEKGISSLDLFDFFVRYQSLSGSKFGNSGVGTGTINLGSDPVPEPASWAMLIAGFGLVGASLRRRRMLAAA